MPKENSDIEQIPLQSDVDSLRVLLNDVDAKDENQNYEDDALEYQIGFGLGHGSDTFEQDV